MEICQNKVFYIEYDSASSSYPFTTIAFSDTAKTIVDFLLGGELVIEILIPDHWTFT